MDVEKWGVATELRLHRSAPSSKLRVHGRRWALRCTLSHDRLALNQINYTRFQPPAALNVHASHHKVQTTQPISQTGSGGTISGNTFTPAAPRLCKSSSQSQMRPHGMLHNHKTRVQEVTSEYGVEQWPSSEPNNARTSIPICTEHKSCQPHTLPWPCEQENPCGFITKVPHQEV